MLYIFLLGLFIFFSNITKRKEASFLFIVFFTILFLLSCFRYGSGTDYWNYNLLFSIAPNRISNISIISFLRLEPTYVIFSSLLKQLGFNFQYIIIIYSFIALSFIFATIKKFSNNILFSFFIFFSNYYLIYVDSAIRQGVAISIFLYSFFSYLEDLSYRKYFFRILLAFMFHYSAIILFFLPLVFKLPKNFFVSLRSILFFTPFFVFLGRFLPNIVLKILGLFIPKFLFYEGMNTSYITIFLRIIFIFLVVLLYNNNKNGRYPVIEKTLVIYIFGAYLYFLLSSISIFSRLTEYFYALEIILIPNLLINYTSFNLKRNQNVIFKLLFCFLFSFLLLKDIGSFIKQGGYKCSHIYEYPYFTIFDHDEYKSYRNIPYGLDN